MTVSATPIRLGIAALTTAGGGAENLWRYFVTDPVVRPHLEPVVIAPQGYRSVDPGALRAARVPVLTLVRGQLDQLRYRLMRRLSGVDAAARAQWDAALHRTGVEVVWITIAGMGELPWTTPLAECCRARRVPYWLNLQHAEEDACFADEAQTSRVRAVVEGAACVLVVSERNRRSLERALGIAVPHAMRGVNGPSAAVVSMGERVIREAVPRTHGTVRLRSLGRFDTSFKGQDLLLEVLATPRWLQRDWTLALQGGGQHRALLEQLIAHLGFAPSRVTLLDRDEDLERTFRATDLLVMPSRSEGSPFALVEAMVCGRPAVVTPVGGQDELVRDGETGWVAASVSVAGIDQALERAWASRALWPAMGRAARAHALAGWSLKEAHETLLEKLRAGCR